MDKNINLVHQRIYSQQWFQFNILQLVFLSLHCIKVCVYTVGSLLDYNIKQIILTSMKYRSQSTLAYSRIAPTRSLQSLRWEYAFSTMLSMTRGASFTATAVPCLHRELGNNCLNGHSPVTADIMLQTSAPCQQKMMAYDHCARIQSIYQVR